MNINAQLQQLEQSINQLRRAYDAYFMGLERIAPVKQHEQLSAMIRQFSTVTINNTAQKFKRNNLVARFNTLQTRWSRVMRQIEDGTYKRDMKRAKQLAAAHAQEQPRAETPPQAEQQQTAPPAGGAPNPWQVVYQNYINARKSCGQPANVSFKALVTTLSKQAQTLKAKYNCAGVAFKVTVQDGKAVIKALPRK